MDRGSMSVFGPAENEKMQLTRQPATLNSVKWHLFPTLGGGGVWVEVRLWLGVWFRRVGWESGGSKDVLAGPAFGGCIRMIVCQETDQVKREKKNGQKLR